MSQETNVIYQFGRFRLDLGTQRLTRDGMLLSVSGKTIELLGSLVESAGEVVTAQDLAAKVWPNRTVEDHEISSQILNLRKALEDTAATSRYVRTIPGRGFRFEEPVSEILKSSVSEEMASSQTPTAEVEEEPEAPAAKQTKLGLILGVTLGAIVVTTLAVWMVHFLHASNFAAPQTSTPSEASTPSAQIAVLPFRSLSGNIGDEKLDAALTEALIASLGRTSQLAVFPLSAISKYNSGQADPVAAARELGATIVVSGMVQRLAGRAWVSVQVLSVQDGRQLWAGGFDVSSNDLPGLSGRISEKIGKQVPGIAADPER